MDTEEKLFLIFEASFCCAESCLSNVQIIDMRKISQKLRNFVESRVHIDRVLSTKAGILLPKRLQIYLRRYRNWCSVDS